MSSVDKPKDTTIVVYDGECPFCTNYVRMMRLQDVAGKVELVDARKGGPYIDELNKIGFDLDEGMALWYGNKWYHGADCLHILALMTSRSGLFNRLTAWMFKSEKISHVLYPFLRCGRNLTLKLLGRKPINS